MSPRSNSHVGQGEMPIQPVERPILNGPYEEPAEHWVYDTETGQAQRQPGRRRASYWFRTQRVYTQQMQLRGFAEEEREDLPLVNHLREDVRRWRASDYEGATPITKELLRYWQRADRPRRLFFCQVEAAETIILLNEVRLAGRRLRFRPAFTDEELLRLYDHPADPDLSPLTRLGVKMATGSGKTVVMAMIVAWAFCNRARVPSDVRFPSAVLAVCPNLTIKERLQVLRPENAENYYAAFDLLPATMRPLLNQGRVLVTNWHLFAPESEHAEGGQSYTVVHKGPESPTAFARRVLQDLHDRAPILVLNDEAHHAWRPRPTEPDGAPEAEEGSDREEVEEATVWVNGLDQINQAVGIRCCVDLSATPFYIAGSGQVEGSPFPWLVSDFGLVDAIESGLVKIPRLPVSDTTGRPEPEYFRLWEHVQGNLQPGDRLPGRGRKAKPEALFRELQPALNTLAGQWLERFKYIQEASNEKDKTPPVLIIVCDNTDLAQFVHQEISGEQVIDVPDETPNQDAAEDDEWTIGPDDIAGEEPSSHSRKSKTKTRVTYSEGVLFPEYLSNREGFTPTIRIDSRLLAEAEAGTATGSRKEAAEALRRIVATVGKVGQPGEQVRCIVSVAMLNEGWDANNVTSILGVRAFSSQLLCEQVVGRGLRRMDYTVDPKTGRFTEEYVDIYGVPFSLIPFKGRDRRAVEPEDRPKNHVRALEERAAHEIRFPVVEGYAYALRRNLIKADIAHIEPLRLEPEYEPTAVFVTPRVGYQVGRAMLGGPGERQEQTREAYYHSTHLQTIAFELARQIVFHLVGDQEQSPHPNASPQFRQQSRHQLFPQVLRLVQAYIERRVDSRGVDLRELGQDKYFARIVERMVAAIQPDDAQGEAPLMPILNRLKPVGSSAEVDFKTTRTCYAAMKSHINLVPTDTATWESSAAFRLEQSPLVRCYVRNDGLGFAIPYRFQGSDHLYEPDYLVVLASGLTLLLEIKGMETEQDRAKHEAARQWLRAVNHWGQLGQWSFHINRDPQVLGQELRQIHV